MLGFPDDIRGCLFYLDGVLTKTPKVHAAAWKQMSGSFLRDWSRQTGAPFVPFDQVKDYDDDYVDGRPREEGTRAFLASRNITLPEGTKDDSPGAQTIHRLSNRKNEILLAMIRPEGVGAYDGSVRCVQAVRDAGLRRAVVSSSANCRDILQAAHIEDPFEVRIDGITVECDQLRGKPAPDTFLAGAKPLGLEAAEAVVFEDARAGVAAGRAGKLGYVVGADRVGQADGLRQHGADVVVRDLAGLLGQP